jgi:hypothetical protein
VSKPGRAETVWRCRPGGRRPGWAARLGAVGGREVRRQQAGLCSDDGDRVVWRWRQQGGAAAGNKSGRVAGRARCGGAGLGSGRVRG